MWQPKKDSNPHKQSQSLSCYLYTIRLNACRFLQLNQYTAFAGECQALSAVCVKKFYGGICPMALRSFSRARFSMREI